MKPSIVLLMFLVAISTLVFALRSCPTCIGKITKDSPPFFSNAFDNQVVHELNDATQNSGESYAMEEPKQS